ncbi:MAG: TonB C-terminal domain-containing protein [Alphaproteobacteria bacterium]|nr:TonB C-terminal domain-containing protein [Alphaproteobacteria bacterium]
MKTDKPDNTKKKKTSASKNFDDLLNELSKEESGSPSRGKGAPASTIGAVLTASEKDALSRHIAQCWIIPAGLRDARNIRVPIKINVSRDGTVQKAEIVDKARMSSDLSYRTAAESARRAVLDPRCSPLPIPADKYDMFKEFTFNFDPKEMF